MYGVYKKILRINLSEQTYFFEPLDPEILSQYPGGKALGTYLLAQQVKSKINPLSPENPLIFTTGPCSQSVIWGSSRYAVFGISPQTGFYAESYAGGKAPEAMDRVGVDALILEGQSAEPVVLKIEENSCTFYPAQDLWGKDTYTTEDEVLRRYGNPKLRPGALVIGPAGENQVSFALIENNYWRSAGRCGLGAVLGAKKVKALVFQGQSKRTIAREQELKNFAFEFLNNYRNHPVSKNYLNYGTTQMVSILNQVGAFPARYWQQGTCSHWEQINGEALRKLLQVTPHACPRCFLACGKISTVPQGRYKGLTVEGPEYETIFAFGGLCLVKSLPEIMYLNDLCDQLGLDTISAGNLCAFTIEAVRQKKVKFDLDYGQTEKIAELIKLIAFKQDIGEVLAQGIKKAAQKWDMEDYAVHVKGLEPAGYDPRYFKGMALSYAISDRGACHLRTTFYKPELAGVIDPATVKDKARLVIDYEDRLNVFDSLILCRFYRDFYPYSELAKILTFITGDTWEEQRVKNLGAQVAHLARKVNLSQGLTSQDDSLPKLFFKLPLENQAPLSEEEFDYLKQEYYQLRGWPLT